MSLSNNLTSAIVTYLNYNGCFVWRNNTIGVYDPTKKIFRKNKNQLNGIADIVGVLPNSNFLAVEVKIGKDKLSEAQEEFRRKLTLNGGIYIIAKNFDDFVKDIILFL